MMPADEVYAVVYDKDLSKSGFPQQSSVTSSLEPASARPPSPSVAISRDFMFTYSAGSKSWSNWSLKDSPGLLRVRNVPIIHAQPMFFNSSSSRLDVSIIPVEVE